MIEPFRFFKVEFGAAFMYAGDREFFYKLIFGEYLLFCSVVPAQHGKQVDKCLGQKSDLLESFGDLACFWIGSRRSGVVGRSLRPIHCINRETQTISIPFT